MNSAANIAACTDRTWFAAFTVRHYKRDRPLSGILWFQLSVAKSEDYELPPFVQ